MSTIRDPAYITNAGRTMMTAGGEVTYTKAVLYGQDISGLSDSQIKALTSLGNPLREVKIGVSDKQSSDSGSTVILEAVFQNSDLKADLEYKAVGFFARKNDVEQLVIVAVANQGAYLAATNPDGVATDALDLKIAVEIGDATSVTAVIDPAGSVTPASLNSAIKQATQELTAKIDTKSNSQDVQNALNQKADKSTVEDSLATKANVTDLNQLSSEVAKKAATSDLANLVTEVSKKATSDDVTAQISDVNKSINTVSDTVTKNKDAIDKQIASLTTTVNAKVDASYSYSREELDKKFLALSVSADGKMSAEQVTSMVATKADKSYVDEKLDEKADKSSVDAKINAIDFSKIGFTKQYITNANGDTDHHTWFAKKQSDGTWTVDITDTSNFGDWTAAIARNNKRDIANLQSSKADTSTVNAQIADVKDTAQSNLDKVKSDLNGAINTKANSDDVYNKPAIDSAFNTRDNSINRAQSTADGAQTTANNALPKAGGNMNLRSNINWNGGGINDRTGNLGGLQWAGGTDTVSIYGDQDDNDNLDLAFDLGDDGSNHFSFRNKGSEVAGIQSNGHYTGTVDWGNVWGRPDVTPIVNGAAGDDLFAFKSNQIRLYPGNGQNCKNLPPASNTQWFTVQYVFENLNGDGVAIFRSPANEVWMVGNNGGSYTTGWTRLANSGDISNLQNIINQQNQTIQSLTTRLANAENEIRYIKANYVEGRTFPASQEAQANSWESGNPQRLAFITK